MYRGPDVGMSLAVRGQRAEAQWARRAVEEMSSEGTEGWRKLLCGWGHQISPVCPGPKGRTETWGDLSCVMYPTPAVPKTVFLVSINRHMTTSKLNQKGHFPNQEGHGS